MEKYFTENAVLFLRDETEDLEVEIRILAYTGLEEQRYIMAVMAEEDEAFILKVAKSRIEDAAYLLLSGNGEIVAYAAEPEMDQEWNRVVQDLEKKSTYIINSAEEQSESDPG